MNFDVPHPLISALLARPDHPALIAGDDAVTYGALIPRVARRAGGLRAAGVGPGQTVALVAPPGIDWWVDFWAIGWIGAAVAPVDHRLPPPARARALAAIAPDRVLDGDAARPRGLPLPERPWPLDEIRLVIATSGTTGAPTIVRLATGQLVFSAMGSMLRLGHAPDDRWLACLPPHHIGGASIGIRCAFGATTALLARFEPSAIAARLDAGEASLVSLTPAMLEAVLDARAARPFPPDLRALLLGGAHAPAPLIERCRALGAPVATTWGMTEAASQIATRAPGDLAPGAPPLPFARVSVDPHGALTVSGPVVAGARITADRGRVEGGRVFVEGRRDDVIISGGLNLSPGAIEDALRRHPAVRDAGVVAVADARWGQRPAAALVLADRAHPPPEDALRALCRAEVGPHAAPARFAVVDGLPRGDLGKLRRAALAPLFADPTAPTEPTFDLQDGAS